MGEKDKHCTQFVFNSHVDMFQENMCVLSSVVQVQGSKRGREEPKCCTALRCEEAVGGRGGSAAEIIPGFCPKPCARWADQGLREEWCYPVAVTQPRAFHLTSLAALQPAGLETQR